MTSPDLEALKALVERRIPAALKRITDGHGLMRVPAEDTDPDLVLADCRAALERLLASQGNPEAEAVADPSEIPTLAEMRELFDVPDAPVASPPVQEAGRPSRFEIPPEILNAPIKWDPTNDSGPIPHPAEPASLGADDAAKEIYQSYARLFAGWDKETILKELGLIIRKHLGRRPQEGRAVTPKDDPQ